MIGFDSPRFLGSTPSEVEITFASLERELEFLVSSEKCSATIESDSPVLQAITVSHDSGGKTLRIDVSAEKLPHEVSMHLIDTVIDYALLDPLLEIVRARYEDSKTEGTRSLPSAPSPFEVRYYKAAYRRDYYTQFIRREDMLRLPAYNVTEREDGSVVTQIYPDMMAGESAEALDFMERCAWHFDKYHRVYGSTIYTLPEEWAEGGFFYRQERRLFGPNGLDGIVPQDLGLL